MMDEIDVRAIVSLLGEVSLLKGNLAQKKRFLLARLCSLVGGDAWSWSLSQRGPVRLPHGMSGSALGNGTLGGSEPVPAESLETFDLVPPQLELTVRQISEDGVSSISLSRKPGRPVFSARERKIAHIVLTEIPWLHENAPALETPVNGLSPRQRATLIHLADGLPRRAIAQQLRLSQHTVDGYVKAIYQHYRVNSRATLMRRFAMIGGEEVPR
jgi:DNA-binding CsgD family transcriptional regulator